MHIAHGIGWRKMGSGWVEKKGGRVRALASRPGDRHHAIITALVILRSLFAI